MLITIITTPSSRHHDIAQAAASPITPSHHNHHIRDPLPITSSQINNTYHHHTYRYKLLTLVLSRTIRGELIIKAMATVHCGVMVTVMWNQSIVIHSCKTKNDPTLHQSRPFWSVNDSLLINYVQCDNEHGESVSLPSAKQHPHNAWFHAVASYKPMTAPLHARSMLTCHSNLSLTRHSVTPAFTHRSVTLAFAHHTRVHACCVVWELLWCHVQSHLCQSALLQLFSDGHQFCCTVPCIVCVLCYELL